MVKADRNNSKWWERGLNFSCINCGRCCRHEPGYVYLSEADLARMAEFKGLTKQEFLNTFCRTIMVNDKPMTSLKEKDCFDCIFWNRNCTVYPSRPVQCRTYPFWPHILKDRESWENEASHCPGINHGQLVSGEQIREALTDWENNTYNTSM